MKKFFNELFGSPSKTSPKRPAIRQSSHESVFTSVTVKANAISSVSRLNPINKRPENQSIYDSISFIIYCPKHSKLAVSTTQYTNDLKAVWLPFIHLSPHIGWESAANDGVLWILSDGKPKPIAEQLKKNNTKAFDHKVLEVLRIQLPQTQRFVERVMFLITLTTNQSIVKCCQKNSAIDWIGLSDAMAGKVADLWGPEVTLFSRSVNTPDVEEEVVEYGLDDVYRYVPREPPRNHEEEMLSTLKITEKDIERVYIDFVEHCFPSFYMTKVSFIDYMSKYGFKRTDKRLNNLFTACNYNMNGYLCFHELLLGLASLEPKASTGVSRIKFVFKYFDVDRDGYLNDNEFKLMVKDINKTDSEQQINKKVKEGQQLMNAGPKGINFEAFNRAVGALKFRGTSQLCKSDKPIFTSISNAMVEKITNKTKIENQKAIEVVVNEKIYKGICLNCRSKRYGISTHSVKLTKDGLFSDAIEIKEVKEMKNKLKSTERTDTSREILFNPKSVANYFIEKIKAFNGVKGKRENPKGLMDESSDSRNEFLRQLELLCKAVTPILQKEDRCLQIDSPALVIGDIHGNLEDLLSIEKYFFKSAPIVCSNFLFLGDYVDRGKWSIECAIYVLSLKLLAPNTFHLLRGNHEVRDLQKQYTFYKECQTKYQSLGSKVFECLNNVFDRLPLAAVIDESIFCCHGGIPATTNTIEGINQISNNLPDPENDSSVGWEMLWNDPIEDQMFEGMTDLLKVRKDISRGFVTNTKRGTAFFFNSEAANDFLNINGLSHIIRAHEVPRIGFGFHFDRKCITVFSCSHYCGNDNISAVVHISDQKIRLVRLDTKNNAPATDVPEPKRRSRS